MMGMKASCAVATASGFAMAVYAVAQPVQRRLAFDTDALDVLQGAFEAAWTELKRKYPYRDALRDADFRTTLSKAILKRAAEGVVDSNDLRESALAAVRSRLV
jgi:hypothetical protein